MAWNNSNELVDLRFRLAAALLLHYGELSITDIQALPMVESRDIAEIVADELTKHLGAERSQKRIVGTTLPMWEDVMQLPSDETRMLQYSA